MRPESLAIFLFAFQSWAASAPLTLDQYLESVRQQNQGFQAAQVGERGARLFEGEGRLVWSPALFGSYQYGHDEKPSPIPLFSYDALLTENYTLGLSQQTPIGLQAKLYYSLTHTEYRGGPNPGFGAPYAEGRPTLELTQSLWRNFGGREVRAQVDAATATAKAKRYEQSYSQQVQLVQAEAAYWRLALALESQSLAKANLDRAEKIYAWASRRVRLSLADKSDSLQATAGLKARQLELQSATNEVRSASLAFNSARGVKSDQVSEALMPLSKDLVQNIQVPQGIPSRQDVLAAEQQAAAGRAQAIVNRERNQPTLELFGLYAYNRREDSSSEVLHQIRETENPSDVVGIRFSSPLNFGLASDVRSGWDAQARAANLALERQRFLQEQDWLDLVRRFSEAKETLTSAEELESVQHSKVEHERSRQKLGRSTLFQVMTFETDYLNAQGLRLKAMAQLVQTAAQMKLYGVQSESR